LIEGQDVRAVLGRNVKFFRTQRQLSQAGLAEKAGISITFLSNIERGLKFPTSDTLSHLANSLEVEVYELFRLEDAAGERKALIGRFSRDITQRVLETLEKVCSAYQE
jgi:transcriptional regulator with XRE-family HTH domain